MTAEVIVMNRLGIGIAADSAVTLSVAEATKIYTSADKLFQLSEKAPVGLLIYGNASLLGVPWETIVKVYRNRLGDRVFRTVQGYADDFMNFLGKNRNFFGPEVQKQFLHDFAASYYRYLFGQLQAVLRERAAKGKTLTPAIIGGCLKDLVNLELGAHKKAKLVDGISAKLAGQIVTQHRSSISRAKTEVLGQLPRNKSVDSGLTQLIGIALTRRSLGGIDSGIVVAGFGQGQHFPTIIEIIMRGLVNNRLLAFVSRSKSIGLKGSAYVAPFAQGEMVATFMDGIDPELKAMIEDETSKLFHSAVHVMINEVGKRYASYASKLN